MAHVTVYVCAGVWFRVSVWLEGAWVGAGCFFLSVSCVFLCFIFKNIFF